MSAARTIAVLLIGGALVNAALASPAKPVRLAASSAELTPGAGRELAERACLFCHSPMLITQQAKNAAAWDKTLTQMQTWGAPLSAAERDTLSRYLVGAYGPRAAR